MLENKSIKIVFSDEIPVDGKGTLLHYDHLNVMCDNWDYVDIRSIVKDNVNEWLDDIDSWHKCFLDSISSYTSWWTFFPASRLILWETDNKFSLKPLIFTAGLMELVNRGAISIHVVSPSDELVKYTIESSCNNNLISVVDERVKKRSILYKINKAYKFYSHFILIKQFLKVFFLILFRKKKKTVSTDIVVNSFLIDYDLIKTTGDHYFGCMLDDNGIKKKYDILWLYNDLDVDYSKVEHVLSSTGRAYCFISNFIRFKDLFSAIYLTYTSLNRVKKQLKKIPNIHLGFVNSGLFSSDFLSSFVFQKKPFIEFVYYKAYTRLVSKTLPKFIVYPYEEKTIEHALLKATESSEKKIKKIAYAHAGYSLGHLYIRRKICHGAVYPDIIAVTGEASRSYFIKNGVPREQLLTIGTHRSQNLNYKFNKNQLGKKLKLLFIVGLGFEMTQFVNLLVNNRSLADEYDIAIRRSFHSWQMEQDNAEKLLVNNNISIVVGSNNLIDDINNSDVVLYESTTAALQASLTGRIIVQLNLSSIIRTDQFISLEEDSAIEFCKDYNELKLFLNKIDDFDSVQYENYATKQREQVKMLYSKIDFDAVNKMLTL